MKARFAGPWLALATASSAQAAGGAHVVDDATVETPGVCHLESWITGYGGGRGLANASPACTPKALPRLEVGAALQRLRSDPDDTVAGPALKLNLRRVETGVGIGVAAAVGWSLNSGRAETAGVTVPVTMPVGERLRINLNAGWAHTRAGPHRHEAAFGAQAEVQVTRTLGVMVETFGRNHGRPGAQAGLRWTPDDGPVDLDLLVGRRVDGASRTAVTLGLTVRR